MFTRERPEDSVRREPGETTRSDRRLLQRNVFHLAVPCAVAALLSVFFIGLYFAKHYTEPVGWDTARYLDQTNLVLGHGLREIGHLHLPRPSQTLSSRVGFPVTVVTLSRLLSGSTFEGAAVVPIVAIIATALAAGAFVSFSLRRNVWEAATVALVVGTSSALVRLFAGTYTDNLLAAALLAAALVPIVSVVLDGQAFIGGMVLMALAAVMHPSFYVFVLVVLGLVAVVYLPASWMAWRERRAGLLETPSARLGILMGGSLAAVGATIYGLLHTVPSRPELSRGEFRRKLKEDVPLYRFRYTAPVAAVGIGAIAWDLRRPTRANRSRGEPPRRSDGEAHARWDGEPPGRADRGRSSATFVLVLMSSWGAVTALGVAALSAGRALPAHRLLAFLLPFPILMALGFLGIGRLVAKATMRVLGVVVVIVGIAAAVLLGYRNLYGTLDNRGLEFIDHNKILDASSAQAYLQAEGVPEDAPVVFVINDDGPDPQEFLPEESHIMRSVMDARRIEHAYFYIGTPENYLAGVVTQLPNDRRRFNVVSSRFFKVVSRVLPQRPVALLLAAYSPDYTRFEVAHPDARVAYHVLALSGPGSSRPVPVPPFPAVPRGFVGFAVFQTSALLALTLIGVGWAVALLPRGLRPFEVLSLSLSFGLGALALAGTLADVVGLRLGGTAGALAGPVVGGTGWVIAALRVRRTGWPLIGVGPPSA